MELTGYQIVGEVASGSTGTVYRARQEALGRDVAIKALDPALASDPVFRERFRAEARVLAGLRDDHIVSLFGYVEDDTGAWIVQEWVDGASLGAVLGSHGPLSAEQALGVTRGALLGLTAAHAAGVVHGDVSTSNILVTADGLSTLVDFGLAGPSGSPGLMGTPAFGSPESRGQSPMTARSDVYSAAAVLVSLLTGSPPDGADVGAVRAQHGDRLADVLGRCLALDPATRPADAAEMLALLDAAAEDRFGAGWLVRSSVAGLVGGPVTYVARSTSQAGGSAPGAAGAAAMTVTAGAAGVVGAPSADELPAGAAGGGPTPPRGKGRVFLAAGVAVVLVAVISGVALGLSGNEEDTAAGSTTTTQQSASTSSPDGTTEASPTPQQPAFAGTYSVTQVITAVSGPDSFWADGTVPGKTDVSQWLVVSECAAGTCDVTATSSSGRVWPLAYEAGVWAGEGELEQPCLDSETGEQTGEISTGLGTIRLQNSDGGSLYPLTALEGTFTFVVADGAGCSPAGAGRIDNSMTLERTGP